MSHKVLTILVVPHDERHVRRLRLSYRALAILGAAGGALLLLVLILAGSWGQVAARAAQSARLERENRRLLEENAAIDRLAANLDRTERAYRQIRLMAGLGEEPAEVEIAGVGAIPAAVETELSPAAPGASLPRGWPLAIHGFMTAGFTGREGHPGVDIAAPLDTPVLSTAAGRVKQKGTDPVYGVFVILLHGDGYETMYAHNRNILVEVGDSVERGETIATSGNSGQSSAPHLHYEVRRSGWPVDPTPFLK